MEWNRLPIVVATMVGFYIADRSSGEVPPPIDELVTRLANSDRRVRDEAIQLLEARGAASLPLLRQALKDKDENVRAIARSFIELIETKVALAPKGSTEVFTNSNFQQFSRRLSPNRATD